MRQSLRCSREPFSFNYTKGGVICKITLYKYNAIMLLFVIYIMLFVHNSFMIFLVVL